MVSRLNRKVISHTAYKERDQFNDLKDIIWDDAYRSVHSVKTSAYYYLHPTAEPVMFKFITRVIMEIWVFSRGKIITKDSLLSSLLDMKNSMRGCCASFILIYWSDRPSVMLDLSLVGRMKDIINEVIDMHNDKSLPLFNIKNLEDGKHIVTIDQELVDEIARILNSIVRYIATSVANCVLASEITDEPMVVNKFVFNMAFRNLISYDNVDIEIGELLNMLNL
jgi:hypothetical protein